MRRLPLLVFLLSLALSLPADGAATLRSGPMLGWSEITGTIVWLQTSAPAAAQVRYWKAGAPEGARLSPVVETGPARDHIARFILSGLEFGSEYEYEIYLDGARIALPETPRFRTQPMWRWRTDPPVFKVAVGSCAYINDPPFDRPGTPYGGGMEIFEAIAGEKPELMLWIGDNIYYREADWETEAGMRRRQAHNRALPELRRLLASTHNYATWDDHDYGPNDSDRTYPLREVSLEVFRDYWPARTAGHGDTKGVFQKFTWGDVDFFLMDDRYHRSPNDMPRGPGKTMWGEAQLQWLMESLASSSAPFKIVVNGNQVLNDAGEGEALPSFSDYARLMDFLAAERIPGVVFVSGDRHHGILMKAEREGLYPLYDLTTSPLTAGVSKAREGTSHPRVVPGTYYEGRNYATLEFAGPRTARTMTIELHDAAGKVVWSRAIAASELRSIDH